MKCVFWFCFFSLLNSAVYTQVLVSKILLGSFSKTQLDSLLQQRLGSAASLFTTQYGVDAYKLLYKTMDYDSSVKMASALLAIPRDISCPLAVVNYSHGTTSVKEDVPSRLNGEGLVGLVAAANGMVMCEPDYFGMGDGEWPHYYLHAFTHAMTNIDLLRATREACQQLGVLLNGQLFLSGYSQGGFSTMVTHKYIETYFPNEFTVTHSFPGAGSYDMSGAMVDLMLSDLDYPSPAYLPFLIFTWNHIYNFFTNPSDYLKAPYDTSLPPKINGMYSIGQINALMPDTPKLIFHPHVIDSFVNNLQHPFRIALRENDVYRWVPQAPMTMIHCRADRQVPIENTRNAFQYFITHGATQVDTLDLNPTLSHGSCGQLYLFYLKNYLDSLVATDPCLSSDMWGISENRPFTISPNPVTETLTLTWNKHIPGDYLVQIHDMNGRILLHQLVHQQEVEEKKSLNVQHMPEGVYLMHITARSFSAVSRFIVFRR